jgi:hypothetical protein
MQREKYFFIAPMNNQVKVVQGCEISQFAQHKVHYFSIIAIFFLFALKLLCDKNIFVCFSHFAAGFLTTLLCCEISYIR